MEHQIEYENALGPSEAGLIVRALNALPPDADEGEEERRQLTIAMFSKIEDETQRPLAYYSLVRTYQEQE